jgi:hypothetical protein
VTDEPVKGDATADIASLFEQPESIAEAPVEEDSVEEIPDHDDDDGNETESQDDGPARYTRLGRRVKNNSKFRDFV